MGCQIYLYQLTWKYAVQHKVAISDRMFSKNTTILNKDQMIMIYRIDKGLPINLGQFVFNVVIKASSEIDTPLLYPNTIFQVLKKQGCRAKPTPDLVTPSPLTFSKTLFTSDRVKDLPYTGAAVSNGDDSTFDTIINYHDFDADVGPSYIPSTVIVQKVLSGLPSLIKKVEGLIHALKDPQVILRKICLAADSEDESQSSQGMRGRLSLNLVGCNRVCGICCWVAGYGY